MKSNEVLKLLCISREHLSRLVKRNKIRGQKKPNGHYIYNKDDVYKYAGITQERVNCIYTRVSSSKQRNDLFNQIEAINQFCIKNGYPIQYVFSDIASGISFERRKDLFKMIEMVLARKINKVFISYKDRLSRIGFSLFKILFQNFGTEIIILNESQSEKLNKEEIFSEIISLIHCFSMKHYSSRRMNSFKRRLKDDLQESLFSSNENKKND